MKYEIKIEDHITSDFLAIPDIVYENDATWTRPYKLIEKLQINNSPTLKDTLKKFIIIYENSIPKARAVVFSHNTEHAFFGGLECVNDKNIFSKLLDEVKKISKGLGAKKLIGPLKYSVHEEVGIVGKGCNEFPHIWTPYNPSYYQDLLDNVGLKIEKNFYAYKTNLNAETFKVWAQKHLEREPSQDGIHIREFFPSDIEEVIQIYNDSVDKKYKPFTIEDAKYALKYFLDYGDKSLCLVATQKNKIIGFLLAMPNLHEFFSETKKDIEVLRLIKFLYRTKTTKPKSVRIMTIGQSNKYRLNNLTLDLIAEFWKRANSKYESLELSYVDSENNGLIKLIDKLHFDLYKTYNLYSIDL